MRYILYGLVLILLACKPDEKVSNVMVGTLISDSTFWVDTYGTFKEDYWEGFSQTTIDGENYLIGIDWMRRKLDIVHFEDANKSFTIALESEGPNGLPNSKLSLITEANNIFILNNIHFYICKLDITSKELKVIKKQTFTENGFYFNQTTNLLFYPNMPMFSICNEHAYIPYYKRTSFGDPLFFKENNLLVINLNDSRHSGQFIEWPLAYLYDDETLFQPVNQKLFTLATDDFLYISYPYTSLIKKIPINGAVLGEVLNWAEPLADLDQLVLKENHKLNEKFDVSLLINLQNNAHFWPLQYNPTKDQFYRVFLYPLGEEHNKKRFREREKWLLEYDREGRLVTKTLIPRELEMQPILLPDGAYGFPKSPTKEDFMEFAVYR